MKTRSPSHRAIGALLVAVLMVGIVTLTEAQQAPPRGGQRPGPRFLVSTLVGVGNGGTLGFQVANAVRDRIASDFDMRTLWVVPESTITKHLKDSGYAVDQPLSSSETRQLAQAFRADEVLRGKVFKLPSGGYRVEADWSLTPRDDMVQPLPTVEAAKISDVAKMVSREFHAARRQVEAVQRCNDLARARNYAGALAAARKAIDEYPRSVLGRVCMANIYAQEKLGPDSMIRISEEILAIHPTNLRALAFAADAYETKGSVDDQVRVLETIVRVDSTRRDVRIHLARVLANAGRVDRALPVIDSAVALNPENVDALQLQWRVHLAAKDWTGALRIGDALIAVDTAAATHDFFVRMIAAAASAADTTKAAALAARGASRFPTDDELALLNVQFLRLTGDLRGALEAVTQLVARSPRAPNAWLQKARIESELGLGADTVTTTLRRAMENGEDRGTVSLSAMGFGGPLARDTAATTEQLRTAIRYFTFAESARATDTTAYFFGTTSVKLAQSAANEARETRQCDLAKESQAALVDAQIALPKAGRSFADAVTRLLADLPRLVTYVDGLTKTLCR